MKYGLAVFLACTALVNAQSVADLPSCSLACFAKAVASTGCGVTDYSCQCAAANKAAIKSSVTPCLYQSTCTVSELETVQEFGQMFCPNYLATATQSSVSSPPTTTSLSSSIAASQPASIAGSYPSTTLARFSASASATPAGNMLGAGMQGTNWKGVHGTSNANRGPSIEAVCVALLVVATSVVAFRIYARLKTRQLRQVAQGLGWDELFACTALVLVGGIVASIITGVRYGMGKHQDHQTAPEIIKIIQVVYAFTLIVTLCLTSLKVSILCLYLRMTPETKHRKAIYVIIGFVVAYGTAAFFGNMFECTPIRSFWNLEKIFTHRQTCVNIITMDVITNSWSAFEDLIIWALPIPILLKLRVPTAKKVGLYTLIGISFISVICAGIRVGAFVIWINSSDISWNFPIYPLLCTIETCIALITSSLPAIYPLFRKPAPEHRRSIAPNPSDSEQAWDSQGSTLRSAQAGDRRSRWSFLSWHPKKLDECVKEVPEEPESIEEERPVTQHTMTAYVSSMDEARSVKEKSASHRRNVSTEVESLCYVGKASDEVSSTSEEEKAVGQAR